MQAIHIWGFPLADILGARVLRFMHKGLGGSWGLENVSFLVGFSWFSEGGTGGGWEEDGVSKMLVFHWFLMVFKVGALEEAGRTLRSRKC